MPQGDIYPYLINCVAIKPCKQFFLILRGSTKPRNGGAIFRFKNPDGVGFLHRFVFTENPEIFLQAARSAASKILGHTRIVK